MEEVSMIRLALILACATLTPGSRIDFYSSPDDITLGLTMNLTLRCALSDTDDQSNNSIPILGRRRRDVRSQGMLAHAMRPDFNAELVTSAVITKRGERNETVPVASVTLGSQPVGFLNVGQLEVDGHVLSQPGERAYLEVTWSRPGPNLRGMYQCRVNATDSIGFPISYIQDIEVGVSEPAIYQVTDKLRELEETHAVDKQTLETAVLAAQFQLSQTMFQLNQTQSQLNQIQSQLNQTQSQLSQTQSQLSQTNSELTTARQQISTITSTMSTLKPPHTEQGTIYCYSWTKTAVTIYYSPSSYKHYNSSSGRESVNHVAFGRPYNNIPAVITSLSMVATSTLKTGQLTLRSGAATGARYQISVEDLTTRGFTLRCKARDVEGDLEKVWQLAVNWMSTVKR